MNGSNADDRPVEPGPAIAALCQHLEAEGIEIDGLDEDFLLTWEPLDALPDGLGDVVELDDPVVVGIGFVSPDAGSDLWTVTLETPPLLALGDVGRLDEILPDGDGNGEWRFDADAGAARLQIAFPVLMEPSDGLDAGAGLVEFFLDLVAELSPTGTRFAGLTQEDAGVETPGFCELRRSEELVGAFRLGEAEEQLVAGSRHLAAARLHREHLVAEAVRGAIVAFDGRVEEGLGVLDRLALELPRPDDCDDRQRACRAVVVGMVGAVNTLNGNFTEADAAFLEADALGGFEGLEWLWDFVRLRFPERASAVKQRLLDDDHLDVIRDDPAAQAESAVLLSYEARRSGDLAGARDWLEQADKLLRSIGDMSQRPFVLAELCMCRVAAKDLAGARAAFEELESFPPVALSSGYHRRMMFMLGRGLNRVGAGGSADDVDEPPPTGVEDSFLMGMQKVMASALTLGEDADLDEQLGAMAEILEVARSVGDIAGEAAVLSGMAEHRLKVAVKELRPDILHQAGLALEDCLEAIRLHDRVRHRLGDVGDRSQYTAEILTAYEHALLIACDIRNDPVLAAELLIRIKAVGLPDRYGSLGTGAFHVVEPPHVTIGSRSALAPDGVRVISLERDRIARQAEPGAWWWSMWHSEAFLFWATVSPEGSVDAGALAFEPAEMASATEEAFSPERMATLTDIPIGGAMAAMVNDRYFSHESLQRPLDQLRQDLPVGGRPDVGEARGIDGVLGTDTAAEPDLMATLGRLLVPERLRRAMLWADRSNPVRILIEPAPSLSWLPLDLLLIETVPGGPSFRLVERAVVQVASPVIDAPPVAVGGSGHGVLAIIDPENDLPVLHPLADRALAVLAGSHLTDRLSERGQGEATIGRVLAALADGDRYRTLLYAGHARSGTADDPLSAGLPLGIGDDREVLSVAELLGRRSTLRSPETVLLFGCSTGADVSPNETERWGLTTAFLLGGARSVVATTWDLLACAATVDLVDRLLSELVENEPAVALRQVQLERLDGWRAAMADGATDFDPDSPDCAHPYLWAPFVAVG